MTPARLSQVQARPFGLRENALSARGPSGMCWAAASVRYRADSVAKLGKRRLTRNNRIGAKDLLNRCCALVAVLESMLPARAPKIVLQQNRGLSGRGAEIPEGPGLTQLGHESQS